VSTDERSDEDQKRLLSELARGAREAFANAEQLFREASLLRDHGALDRSLFLHQISMEECAKVDLLGGWATSLLMGMPVDVAKLARAMASHKVKNRMNAYMLTPGEEETAARQRGDWKGALEAFKAMQSAFHNNSNSAKNAALYVDFIDGRFVNPSERITADMVAEFAETNRSYLGLMYPMMNMLSKWEANAESTKEVFTRFRQRMEELKAQHPNDPDRMMAIIMEEMLENARKAPPMEGARDAPPEGRVVWPRTN
jgi:AbiV family abortive infection protein